MAFTDHFPGLAVTSMSTAEHVAEAIKEQLLHGKISPGTRLRDQLLAASLGVSRNTVREAMTILAFQGLVTKELHRGVLVAELTLEELADVYQARRAIEVAGLRAGMGSGDEWLEGIRRALAAMQDAITVDDLTGVLDADRDFHWALVAPIGSKRISEVYRNLQAELRLTSAWYGEREENPRFHLRHQRILTAIESGDVARAEALVIEVIDAGEARLRVQLGGAGKRPEPKQEPREQGTA
jgi:DNA-binding GntR family transcriptional regulator